MAPDYNTFYDHIADAMDEKDQEQFRKLFTKYRKYFKEALREVCNQSFSRGRDENVDFIRLGD